MVLGEIRYKENKVNMGMKRFWNDGLAKSEMEYCEWLSVLTLRSCSLLPAPCSHAPCSTLTND